MQLALAGLGLIGGSIARAVRAEGSWSIAAWSPAGRGPAAAIRAGVIDRAARSLDDLVRDADVVVVAAPPLAAIDLVRELAASGLPIPGATVTDVVSTKGAITHAARQVGLAFVGGHPMAGREASGFGAAASDLFRDRPWVITEPVGGGDPRVVEELARVCGARPVHATAADHDRAVAAISHLPLLASVALVEAVLGAGAGSDDALARHLAASGWRDMTRLARGDAVMGAGIVATNRQAIVDRLRAYRDRIDDWLAMLERDAPIDPDEVRARLEEARER